MTGKSIDKVETIRDGHYAGLWSGYTVVVLLPHGEQSQSIRLDRGVRGINCKCNVKIHEGQLYVTAG